MAVYGYMRIDRAGDWLQGRSYMEQQLLLKRNGCSNIGCDVSDDVNKPTIQMDILRLGVVDGDTVMVTKLDRLAGTTKECIELIKEFFAKGVKIHILNIGLLEPGTTGEIFLKTVAAIQEQEQYVLLKKAQDRKFVVMTKNGFVEGRPRIPEEIINAALDKIKEDGYSYRQAAKEFGVSEATLYKAAARKRGEAILKNKDKK